MASSARSARLGLGVVCVMFLLTMGILAAKSAEARREAETPAAQVSPNDSRTPEVSLSAHQDKAAVP